MADDSVKADTEYVVLRQSDAGTWSPADVLTARDANAAIRKTYENLSASRALDAEIAVATFVAIPSRSFNPVTVRPKVETTLVLEEATYRG